MLLMGVSTRESRRPTEVNTLENAAFVRRSKIYYEYCGN